MLLSVVIFHLNQILKILHKNSFSMRHMRVNFISRAICPLHFPKVVKPTFVFNAVLAIDIPDICMLYVCSDNAKHVLETEK